MTGGHNDEPNKKMNRGKPRLCVSVRAYVCVLLLYVRVCISHHTTLLMHTHTHL